MRSIASTLLSLPLLAFAPGHDVHWTPEAGPLRIQDEEELDPEEWSEVATFTFPDGLVRAPEGQGAMGTSAMEVELGKVRGTLLVDRRHGDQISVFLGCSPPEKYAADAHEDLRVRFRDTDGEVHVRDRHAGGQCGMQFTSPEDVELAKLEGFSLMVRSKAKWLKGK
jgi:hypothetical protein